MTVAKIDGHGILTGVTTTGDASILIAGGLGADIIIVVAEQ